MGDLFKKNQVLDYNRPDPMSLFEKKLLDKPNYMKAYIIIAEASYKQKHFKKNNEKTIINFYDFCRRVGVPNSTAIYMLESFFFKNHLIKREVKAKNYNNIMVADWDKLDKDGNRLFDEELIKKCLGLVGDE